MQAAKNPKPRPPLDRPDAARRAALALLAAVALVTAAPLAAADNLVRVQAGPVGTGVGSYGGQGDLVDINVAGSQSCDAGDYLDVSIAATEGLGCAEGDADDTFDLALLGWEYNDVSDTYDVSVLTVDSCSGDSICLPVL